MKTTLYSIVILTAFFAPVFGQSPTPTPDKGDDVVKISTTLVQTDVTVTDSKGNIVDDLKPEEIEIYENGKKQTLSNFLFVSNVKKGTASIGDDKTPARVPPAKLQQENVARTVALVVDDLSLSFQSLYFVRRALTKFVDEQMQDGDLVAIIRTGGSVGALQQFTSDKRLLHAAIDRIRLNGFAQDPVIAPGGGMSLNLIVDVGQEPNQLHDAVVSGGTIGGISYVVRGMKDLPGRKSIILLSDGFILTPTNTGGFTETSPVLDAANNLIDLANRASVVINTMDARGLVSGIASASSATSAHGSNNVFETRGGLQYLADGTGGKAIINNNDLGSEIGKILNDQSYYLVGFQPDDETFSSIKSRFNKLEVRVNRKGLKIRYRSGFYAAPDEKPSGRPATEQSSDQKMMTALLSPFAENDIATQINVLFANDAKSGAYLDAFIHVDGKDIKFTDGPSGAKKAVFDVIGVLLGGSGQLVDRIAKTWTFTPTSDDYRNIVEKGIVYQLRFPAKKPGGYQFRLAVRDQGTAKIGSASQFIEVPNLKKDQLTLSSIILESSAPDATGGDQRESINTNLLYDVSMRRFKKGNNLRYEVEIYNAKLNSEKQPQLKTQIRIFRDGKMFLDGKQSALPPYRYADGQPLEFVGALNLGNLVPTGEYVLQVIVTDGLADETRNLATQWISFEVTER